MTDASSLPGTDHGDEGFGDEGHKDQSHKDEDDQSPDPADQVWRVATVVGVYMDLPSQYPEVVLQEQDPPWRELRIPVGLPEGTALSYAHKGLDTPRPLTHQLFSEVIERHGVSIEAVRITARRSGIFHAELDTTSRSGRHIVPCRPSDALALVLRQRMPTPVMVADWLFDSED
jgi:uncharacterized protein